MSAASQRDIQVLHVDDEPSLTDLTETFLEREDDRFTVETATSADDGLAIIEDRPPDCVISDYNMPGMDGLEFLQTVRERYPDLPFILYTGKGSEAVASDAIAADVTDYLQKGSGSEQYELLANRIRNAVQAQREVRRADRQEQLMRLTEFAGDTGGFELDTETGETTMTDGTRRILHLPEQANPDFKENLQYYHSDDRADIQQTVQQALDTGEQTNGTWRYQHPDGEQQLLDVTYMPTTANGDTTTIRGAINDITDRRERQQELRLLQQAIEDAADGIAIIDDEEEYVYVDQSHVDMYGFEAKDELLGNTWRKLYDDDEIKRLEQEAFPALEANGHWRGMVTGSRPDGTTFPAELSLTVVEDGRVICTVRNETERRQRERRFQALVEESNDIISIVDPDGRYQYQSPSVERILGYDPESTIGDKAWEYVHPDDRKRVLEAFETWVDHPDRMSEAIEYRARHADGSWRWMEAEGNDQFDNPAVEGYVINSRDITDRRERQQELRLLQQSIDDANVPITLADPSERDEPLVYVNDAFEEMTGYPPEETLGRNCRFLQGEDTDPEKTAALRGAIDNEEPISVELCNYRKDGTTFWNHLSITPIYDDDGQLVRYLGTQQDITDRKERERQLAELNQASQDLLRAETEKEVTDIGVSAAREILDLQVNAIYLSGADDTQLTSVAQTDEVASLLGDAHSLPVADSIAGRVYQHGEPTVLEDVRDDPDVHDPETDLRGHVYLPLADHGILVAGSEDRAAFDQHDIALGELLAGNLVAALDQIDHEQVARRQEQQLALFFEESSLGAVQWDGEFRFERVNERAEEILGYDEAALRGESWETIVADDDSGHVRDAVETLRAADGGTHVLNRNVGKDGEMLVSEWHSSTVTDDNGNVQSVFSEFQDVTDRERRKTQLEEYETIIESLTDAVYVIDEEGRFTYINDEFVKLVGYDRETILGNTPSLFKDETAVEQAEHQLGRLLSSDGPDTVTFEVTVHPREGEPTVCEDHMGVLPYDGEKFNGSVGMLRDITQHRQYEQKLEAQNERLEEFASIVSHDLRSPLTVAEGNLELAQDTCECEYLARAANAIDRGQALIDDLLTLAREGDEVDETEPVGLAGVAESSWQTVEARQATLEAGGPQVVEADQSRLRQLFENLYRNAVEHGGDDVTVSVGAMENGFYVADTGPGIPESDREEIFEAGYSTDDEGTGFGLRIVEQIAHAHGWEITVTESEQGGARFEITGVEFTDR